MKRELVILLIVISASLPGQFCITGQASAEEPAYGTGIMVDGNIDDWDLGNDYFADMFLAGNPGRVVLSTLYLRYDCVTNLLYALVLDAPGDNIAPDDDGDEAWIKIYNIGWPGNKFIDGEGGGFPSPRGFEWVYDGNDDLIGYEAYGALSQGVYLNFEAHLNIDGETSSTGKYNQGYAIPLTVQCLTPLMDFGDAPDPTYPTLSASNGAWHFIVPDLFLGSLVDDEMDGQPTPGAVGDNTNGVPDDEDGVTFTSLLTPGFTASANVVASAPMILSAWIDFNGDGDWADANENLFPGGFPLMPGVNSLMIPVPVSATAGDTYARFRATTMGPLNFDGPAADGEVEDYMVTIEPEIETGFIEPEKVSLTQNYPNPFNPATTIEFTMPEPGNVTLKVYDVSGREVVTLINGFVSMGTRSVEFDAATLPSGTYFYRLISGNQCVTKSMLLIK